MIDVAEYKRILSQRDDTIIEQADTIAELRSELKAARYTARVGRTPFTQKLYQELKAELQAAESEIGKLETSWTYAEMREGQQIKIATELRAELQAATSNIEALSKGITRKTNELQAARDEIARIKPSWKDAPEWATWRATERDGHIRYWLNRPTVSEYWERWIDGTSGKRTNIEYVDWRETLEQRPTEEK